MSVTLACLQPASALTLANSPLIPPAPVCCARVPAACKRRDTGKMYAMKVMSKNRIKTKNAVDLCWNERVLLAKIKSPFVVR